MSSTSSPALFLDVRSRRAERLLVVILLVAGATLPWLYAMPAFSPAAGAAAGIVLLAASLRRAGWLGGRDCIAFVHWCADGRWILIDRKGVSRPAALHPASRVIRGAAWLRWSAPGRRQTLLLTRMDLPPEDLRRLVVRLRMEGQTAVGGAGEPIAA